MAVFTEILSLIETRHVPDAEAKKVIYSGIHGMLGTLDPHTNFLDDETFREMREEQRGSFFGLGIVISKRSKTQPLRVVSPITDTPAARLGIRAGDVITHIRDRRAEVDTDTLGLTIQESVKFLRGPRGTQVEITVDRPGFEEPLIFEITRDAVRTPAVDQAFMLRDTVGYVHLANFTETTTAELDRALEKLGAQGAEALVLDLSGNPGGLLDQAISVSSRFIAPGQLVVYTEGHIPGSRQNYTSLKDVPRVDWPIVVVLNRGSASASEIVSGAIQDHDRGIVVGETSFGKGLVQSVYPLSEGAALALTTQKYYTPVGRSIQRPYDSQEEYYYENFAREEEPKAEAHGEVFQTETGRTVYGGGGITPDIVVKEDPSPDLVNQLLRSSAFTRFVSPLGSEDRARYAADRSAAEVDFLAFVAKEIPSIKIEGLDESREKIQLFLKAELALGDGGMEARGQVLTRARHVILTAADALDDARQLLAKMTLVRQQEGRDTQTPVSR